MKAIIYTKYGGPEVLQLAEVPKPTPGDNQVLIKVQAAAANALDLSIKGHILVRVISRAYFKPKDQKLGADVAGRVEAVGKNVTQFKPGDEVFGFCHGAFAEYVCTAEKNVALKPANVSFESAAAAPVAALTALQGLRDKGNIQPGQKVLVNGAGGGVGTFAVQIAKSYGAEVTAVCSTRHQEMARSIGADHVIDYSREDVTKNGQQYDLIAAVNGYHSIFDYQRALTPNGIYVVLGGKFPQLIEALLLGSWLSKRGNKKFSFMGIAKTNAEDLGVIKDLLASGKIVPVIDRSYPLSETAGAIRHLIEGHTKGKIVVTVD